MSEASCPNFQPRAHARLSGLTKAHASLPATRAVDGYHPSNHSFALTKVLTGDGDYALLEEQVRRGRARSDDGRL